MTSTDRLPVVSSAKRSLLAGALTPFVALTFLAVSAGAATDSVAAGNVPARTSHATGGLKQLCTAEILKQPKVLTPPTGMFNAGEKSTSSINNQEISVKIDFEAVDPACNGRFKRLPYVMPQLVRHGRTINESPHWLQLFTPGYDPNTAGAPGYGYLQPLVSPKYEYWKPGDRVQFRLRLRALSLATRKIVATRLTTYPISVVRH